MKHPKTLHTVRPTSADARRRLVSRSRKATPARQYAPGHFTAPVLAWKQMGWQPGYWLERSAQWLRLQQPCAPVVNQGRSSAHMTAEREKRARLGLGWGSASLQLPGTPSWRANALDWINGNLNNKAAR